jgi:GDP-mannose pyrophosphatase NudK
MTKSVTIDSERILSNGRFPLSRVAASLVEDDGTRRSLDFEVYRHGPAAAALPYDTERNCVLLVRQFRLGAYLANGSDDVLEAPAGMLDGDAPEICARRELEEETGVKVAALEAAFDFFPSPGGSSEIIHCFFAPYRAADRKGAGGGVDADEHIEIVEIAFAQALALIERGAIKDGKTIALLYAASVRGLFL